MFNINVKNARFALKNALTLTYATSSIMFFAINAIVRVLAIDLGCGVMPLGLLVGKGDLLGYLWDNLSLFSQIFSGVFAITLIQMIIEKKVIKK